MRPTVTFHSQGGGRWRSTLRGVPEDQMKLVSLDMKCWRNRRIGGDRLRLVGVHGDQDFLVDEEARPGDERSHPVAKTVRKAEGNAVSRDAMQRLSASPQRQQLLAKINQRGQGPVEVAVLVEKVAALRA